jgi:predicted nucleic acid-binding Zn ribbon protein
MGYVDIARNPGESGGPNSGRVRREKPIYEYRCDSCSTAYQTESSSINCKKCLRPMSRVKRVN